MISQDAVHRREHGFAFGQRLSLAGQFDKRSQNGVHTATDESRDRAHRGISRAHHAAERTPGDRLVHRLNNASHVGGGVDNQPAEA
jgi:hypothetical protein